MKKITLLLVLVLAVFYSEQSFAQCAPTTTIDTFNTSGSVESWTVPAGVTSIIVEGAGAGGGRFQTSPGNFNNGGNGARYQATFSVTPGEVLQIIVGEEGDDHPGTNSGSGAGGGGATYVTRGTSPADFIVPNYLFVAGGGGGAGSTASGGSSDTESILPLGFGGAFGTGAAFNSGGGGTMESDGNFLTQTNAGGKSAQNGGAGGTSADLAPFNGNVDLRVNGGYGSGGAGGGSGGGGGGFSGGSGGQLPTQGGFPGTSKVRSDGTNVTYFPSDNNSDGFLTITYELPFVDTVPPTIVCPAAISVSADNNSCFATGINFGVLDLDDNCEVASFTTDAPASMPVGTTTVTYTVFDTSGNSASCTQLVTVTDNQNPTINIPGNITQSNDPGDCGAVVTFSFSASDNCTGGSVNQTSGIASGNGYPVGTTTNVFVATDASGNTSTSSFTVTITDTEDPILNCPSNITVNNDSGDCGAVVTFSVSGSDNCGGTFSQTAGLASGENFPVGTTTNTFVATDNSGNTATCSFTVTVNDTMDPVISCSADITVNNDPGQCGAIVFYTAAAADNCSATLSYSQDSGTLFSAGTTTVTVTATDPSGNTSQCSFDVTVNDIEDPVVNCPTNVTVANDAGQCGAIVSFAATATDNCSATVTYSQDPNTFFSVGVTTVTATATDAAGNATTCTFDVTVNDTEAPILTCAADVTVDTDAGICEANVTVPMPTVSDNCPLLSPSSQSSPVTNMIFTTTGNPRTLLDTPTTLSGAVLSSSDVTFEITFNGAFSQPDKCFDLEGPDGSTVYVVCDLNILCSQRVSQSVTILEATWNTWVNNFGSDLTFTLQEDADVRDLSCGGVPETYELTASYSVPGASAINDFNDTEDASGVYPVGTTNVVWTTTDASGNTATCTQVITVEDNEAPMAVCDNITVQLDPSGTAFIAGVDLDGGSTDNCGAITFDASQTIFTCNDIGANNVTLTVTDGNGNTSTCVAVVTVVDQEPPFVFCKDITVQLDANGNASIVAADVDDLSMDNCGAISLAIDIDTFDCSNVGPNNVTLTATDVNGNSSSCTAVVTVVDSIAPVATCASFTAQLDASGMVTITGADVDGGSTDACGIGSLDVSPNTFTCADLGTNNVTLTVTDTNGNSSTCTTVVTVEDNVPPVAVCLNIDVFLDANGDASIVASDVDGGSNDACGIASTSIDVTDFSCTDLGANNVTLTVTDNNGNVSDCVAVVTVIDAIAPTIACPDDITVNNSSGACSAVVTFPDALALDNCSVTVTQTAGLASGSPFPVGVNTVEFTATDTGGNTTVCSFTITVADNEAPVTVCQDITIQLDANGNASIVANDVDGGSFDNCGVITSLSIDVDTFDCSNLGPNNVTLSVTDDNGNTGTCIAIVTVEDVTAPDVVCQDITVQLDAAGTVTIAGIDVDGGSSDACGIDTYTLDIDTFDCSNVGVNAVVLTVTDINGNAASCTAMVTVEDNVGPEIVCMDITVQLDEFGAATILAEDVLDSATDACGIATSGLDISEFDCMDVVTPVTVTVFVIDTNGNSTTCTAVVTVEDNVGPMFDQGSLPEDQTRSADENGEYVLEDFTVDVTAFDNCSLPSLPIVIGQDPAAGTVLTPGVYDITLEAMDDLGNTSEYIFELTVEEFLGVNTVDISTISMYPNPARNLVNLSNPQSIELETASVYDVSGRLIINYDLKDMGTEKALDISMLSSATYLVLIQGPNGQITKQLIKE